MSDQNVQQSLETAMKAVDEKIATGSSLQLENLLKEIQFQREHTNGLLTELHAAITSAVAAKVREYETSLYESDSIKEAFETVNQYRTSIIGLRDVMWKVQDKLKELGESNEQR